MKFSLRLSGKQHQELTGYLYPGDYNESVALLLCGQHQSASSFVFTVREVFPIAIDSCDQRTSTRVRWQTDAIVPALKRALEENLSIVKIHSHPGGFDRFSDYDDTADRELFSSVHGWMNGNQPHCSAV